MGLSVNGASAWQNRPFGYVNAYGSGSSGASQPSQAQPIPSPQPFTPQQLAEQARIAQIQARYADKAPGVSGVDPNRKAENVLARVRADSEAHIRGHEAAHQSAAGSLGGSMSIQYDQNGVAVAGQVPISIPPMDRANPEASLKNYQTVRFAALAPGDPSGQDISVASRAQSLMGQAQVLIARKKQPPQAPESV